MNQLKRAIINVAIGQPYTRYQKRLLDSLQPFSADFDIISYTDKLPPGSPSHHQVMYGFKVYALNDAISKGYTNLLWMDSSCWAIASPKKFFDIIEERGYYFIADANPFGAWVSDFALDMFGRTRDEAMNWNLICGTLYGFNMNNQLGSDIFNALKDYEKRGAFMGAYINDSAKSAHVHRKYSDKVKGHVSNDPRCNGHRHDESVLSHLTMKYNCILDRTSEYFQGQIVRAGKT